MPAECTSIPQWMITWCIASCAAAEAHLHRYTTPDLFYCVFDCALLLLLLLLLPGVLWVGWCPLRSSHWKLALLERASTPL